MTNQESNRLLQLYQEAKAEFERVAHSEIIRSEDYEAARDRAKAALQHYNDFIHSHGTTP